MAEVKHVRVSLITEDPEAVSAARRRLAESRFLLRSFTPGLHLPRRLAADGDQVLVLDARKHGPLLARMLRSLFDAEGLASVPLFVLDPDGHLDYDPMPYATLRTLEDPTLPDLINEAARAGALFARAGSPAMGELRLSPGATMRFGEFIQRHTGILLEKGVSANTEEIVRKRMYARKILSTWEFLNFLQFKDKRADEFNRIIPSVTVGETSFFRTNSHFTAIKRVVIPDLLSRKKKDRHRLRVWSAGCATGEEAYSLAMTFHQEIGDLHEWDFQVLGTDINSQAVRRAREGSYKEKDIRRVPKTLQDRYFTRVGSEHIVDDKLKNLVLFRTLNLNEWAASAGFEGVEPGLDLVFCENVIIYFARPMIEQVIQRFHNILSPGGYLFLGYSESLYKINHSFRNISFQETYFYQRPLKELLAPEGTASKRARTKIIPTGGLPRRTATASAPVADSGNGKAPSPEPAGVVAPADAPEKDTRGSTILEDLNPGLREAYRRIRDGHGEESLAILDRFLLTNPLEAEGHYLKGLALEIKGKGEDAEQEWKRSLFLDPAFVGAHLRLGDAYARRGALEPALIHFRNALRVLEQGAMPRVLMPEGILVGPALLDLCARTVDALETEEVRR